MHPLKHLSAIAILLVLSAGAVAQQAVGEDLIRGMVWTPPQDARAALEDARAMQIMGVEAARVPFGSPDHVYATAARGRIALFVDLPVANLAGSRLRDTLAFAERALDEVAAASGRFRSVMAVGLASSVDTSVPVACDYFERLAQRARDAGLTPYYRTRFIESDVCSGAVDFVLLESRGRDISQILGRWNARHDTPAGIGSLGTEVDDRIQGGHLTPRSPSAQARYLEDGLRAAEQAQPRPYAVFVHRWRASSYGLHNSDGEARPALNVVRGFYTGRQTIFAIDAGAEPNAPPGAGSFTVLGWIIAFLVVVLLALAPRFRELIPRYFMRHGYYREAVQRSMGLEGFAAASVFVGICLAAGVIIGVLLQAMAGTDVFEVAFSGLGEEQRESLISVLRRPLLMVFVGAIPYALWILVNMIWLRLLAGKRYRVRPMQAAVLATFSRWPVIALAVVALLAINSADPLAWLPWIVGFWLAAEFVAGPRMLYDYGKVTRVPMGRAVGFGLLVPFVLGAVLIMVMLTAAGPEGAFLWHLITRT